MKQVVLETVNLRKAFRGKLAVADLNLQVEAGDVYGFLGPNGAGKTTTIKLLLNLIFPDQGHVLLNGYDIRENFKEAIAGVGAIVETPYFYLYLSGRENLLQMARLVPGLNPGRVDEVLEIVGMAGRAKDKVRTYSLGMKQRLGIALALLNNPQLIILDEPTNGLDPQGMMEVRELISRLATEEKITFFISTHLLHEVEQICNKVGILQQGRLLAQGSVAELLRTEYETVEICTSTPEKVSGLLRDLPFVKATDLSERGLLVQLDKGHSARLNHLLVTGGAMVDYLIPQSQSLEQFFLDLTKGDGQIA